MARCNKKSGVAMKTTRLRTITLVTGFVLPAMAGAQTDDAPWAGYSVVDMSYSFGADTIYWPTEKGFRLDVGFEGVTDGGYYYTSNFFAAADHGGTHLDAPKHFARGGKAADEVPLNRLMGPACVIDVSEKALADRDFRLSASDVEAWEAQHGTIPQGCIVLMNTGYARYWPDREKYMGTTALGEEGVANLHFPGFSEASARLLAARGVAAVGLDTPSVDYGQSQDFIVHQYLYGLDIPGFENVANVSELPATGAFVIALPMKIATGSGAPLRIIGLVP